LRGGKGEKRDDEGRGERGEGKKRRRECGKEGRGIK
jgi:hypothetical protein